MSIVSVLLTEKTRTMVLAPDSLQRLETLADIRMATGDPTDWDLPALLHDAVACLTGWGTPTLEAQLLARCPKLGLIAHSAGSIRNLLPHLPPDPGVQVSHAAAQIAASVAELVLLQILSWQRELHLLDGELRNNGTWNSVRERHPGHLLGAQTVGVVGASRTGRAVITLLRAFGSTILVTDPLLDDATASALGVRQTTLQTLLSTSDIVTLHAPLTPATEGMLGARELALLRDGALLVNSARGGLLDGAALLAELRNGRIHAALDVFPSEPLATDSEWRSVPNALISPHAAGHTVESHYRQGDAMVDEVTRFLRGEPLAYTVPPNAA